MFNEKRIKDLERQVVELRQSLTLLDNELWVILNPPKFKHSEEAILMATEFSSEDKVIVLNEVEYRGYCVRHYYISTSKSTDAINVTIVPENRLKKIV